MRDDVDCGWITTTLHTEGELDPQSPFYTASLSLSLSLSPIQSLNMPPDAETKSQIVGTTPPSPQPSASSSSLPNGNGSWCQHNHRSVDASRSEAQDGYYFFFLTPSAARELPRFQYKGEDRSLLYAYVLSPLATFLVERCTPRSLAPNSITLIGLSFMIFAYCAMWYYVPMLEPDNSEVEDGDIPRWIFLVNGLAILVYQTLDNMDGKQARRTGSSSPLGLLFDHGCDAVNSVFGSANWMISMALHPYRDRWLCWSMLFGPYALFYISTWEEYHTGSLIMPIINGPNEGLLGATIMSFISWWYGPQFWQGTDGWDRILLPVLTRTIAPVTVGSWSILSAGLLRNADLLVLASTAGFIQETSIKIVSLVRSHGRHVLWRLVPFLTLLVCSLMVAGTDLQIWLSMPRTSLHLCATLFVEMTCELMLSHMSKQHYQPFRWILLPLVVFALAVQFGYLRAGHWTETFLLIYTASSMTYLTLKAVIVIHEICAVLNIWCFDICTPRRRRPVETPERIDHEKDE